MILLHSFPPPPSFCSLSLALISNKDEGVGLIDIVANESFSSVSLTFLIPGQCFSIHIPLPAGFSLVQPVGCRLAVLRLCCRCQPANPDCPSGTDPPMYAGISPLEHRNADGGGMFWKESRIYPSGLFGSD